MEDAPVFKRHHGALRQVRNGWIMLSL
jgi:hypothetical protein